jgi:hypothetical protein
MIRRVRALFWGAAGALCLTALSNQNPRRVSPEPESKSGVAGLSHVAVILANGLQSPLPRVGTLPVVLRSILSPHKAGAARIVIVVDHAEWPGIMRELIATRRLPASVEWYQTGEASPSIPFILGKVTGDDDYVALIAADRTYHPSLHRRAGEWKRDSDALAFTNGSRLAGLYLLSADRALDASRRCPLNCPTLGGLDAWLVSQCFVPCEPVQDDEWQRVLTSEDRLSAERKLERWLFKPTDGIFARNNRRVSIPISRWAIRYPITPNMVSLFTLGVSLLAGIYFALGGCWNMLVGALLSVLVSILDGCDGEVARMKLQESDFGLLVGYALRPSLLHLRICRNDNRIG